MISRIPSTKKISDPNISIPDLRPDSFGSFVGQEHIKKTLDIAIQSSQAKDKPVWHILLSWSSGYGKTSLAMITAAVLWSPIKIVTGYAFTRPSDLISILNTLRSWDILFIDEIHRLKPLMEEVLYTAMEDQCVDMVMPDGYHIRVPLEPFTLIWATTKLESLSEPLKNRFIYHFHLVPYSFEEKKLIILRYLTLQHIYTASDDIVDLIAQHIESVPRKIANFCIQLKDYCIAHEWDIAKHILTHEKWEQFRNWTDLEKWGLTAIHQHYMQILNEANGSPVWLRTLSVRLNMNEKSIEQDIEPLLFELGKIEKTSRGRVIK